MEILQWCGWQLSIQRYWCVPVGLKCRSVPIRQSLKQTFVSRKVTSSADHEAVNLMVGWWRLRFSMKSCKDGSLWAHMAKISSINLHHIRGILSWVSRNSRSSFPINNYAYDGAIQIPMAVPWICKQFVLLKTNKFFINTYRISSHKSAVGGSRLSRRFRNS